VSDVDIISDEPSGSATTALVRTYIGIKTCLKMVVPHLFPLLREYAEGNV
jgi:hypothetical protein